MLAAQLGNASTLGIDRLSGEPTAQELLASYLPAAHCEFVSGFFQAFGAEKKTVDEMALLVKFTTLARRVLESFAAESPLPERREVEPFLRYWANPLEMYETTSPESGEQ